MTTVMTIAARIKRLLEALRQPVVAPFLADWPASYKHRAVASRSLPVLQWLSQMREDRALVGGLVAAISHAAPSLAWRQTYAANDVSAVFLDNYGFSEIVGSNGPLASERLACGFLVLGPAIHYPRHRHEAEELYVPLSGTAAWQQGDSVWREHPPGTLIHHAREEPHAMRTGAGALLALYVWRSANISQPARLDDA
jgi:histidine ammonia-lyase